ncbi:uncharacterized protein J3R85_018302 [Psidium guajava]|nr:uncharacterized protein J3R85_018302 [Psidium guajava]
MPSPSPFSISPPSLLLLLLLAVAGAPTTGATSRTVESDPTPTPWPHQFHSVLVMNYTGSLQLIDLWYDWPNGRNFNIIRDQLSASLLYDLEWNNGTSFFYTLDGESPSCRSVQLEVGILRPGWLEGASYLGRRRVDGFLCDGWEKADFIRYYEDVETKRPVHWRFYTGREAHVMTFEVGAALEDAKWQAPAYCFDQKEVEGDEVEVRGGGGGGSASASL